MDNNDTGAPPPPLRVPACRWKDEGEGMRGKGEDEQQEVVHLFLYCFLVSIYLFKCFFRISKTIAYDCGCTMQTHAHPRTSKPPPPPHANGDIRPIRVDRRWRRGTGGKLEEYWKTH